MRIEKMATKVVSFETPLPSINETNSELKSSMEKKNSSSENNNLQVLKGLVDILRTRKTVVG